MADAGSGPGVATPAITVDTATDIATGSFTTTAALPAFSASLLSLPIVMGVAGDIYVAARGTSLADAGNGFIDTSSLAVALDGGTPVVVGGTTNSGLGDGRGAHIGGPVGFKGVSAGAHTLDLHLTLNGAGSPAKVLASAGFPLTMVAVHP